MSRISFRRWDTPSRRPATGRTDWRFSKARTTSAELVAAFPGATGHVPNHTYLLGFSEGGLISTLLTEQSPSFSLVPWPAAAQSAASRIRSSIWGTFGSFSTTFPDDPTTKPIVIPQNLIDNWDATYEPAVASAVQADPASAQQLINVTHASIDPADFTHTVVSTTTGVLWYNVFATNDATAEVGGNAYSNRTIAYHGSTNDALLNQSVERFSADPVAVANVARRMNERIDHDSAGDPSRHRRSNHPLLARDTLHAEDTPLRQGNRHPDPIQAYGHCNFTIPQLLGAFKLLVKQATQ